MFIVDRAFDALKYLGYLMVAEGQEIAAYFGRTEKALGGLVRFWDNKVKKEAEGLALARRILANPERVRFTTPESKGMLIYQLTRFGGKRPTTTL